MPVTVRVPVRIVVDPRALAARLEDLGEAVEAATGRALANAVSVVAETRGGYVAHRAAAPVLSWSGAALGAVPPQAREACERVIRDAIAAAVAGNLPPDTSGDSLADRLTAAVSERLETERLARLAGLYTIPGYEDGEPQSVTFDFADETVLGGNAAIRAWLRVTVGEDMWESFYEALREYHGDELPPQVGVIFQASDGRYLVNAWRLPSDETLVDIAVVNLVHFEPVVSGASVNETGSITLRETAYEPSPNASLITLRYLGSGRTVEDRAAVFRAHFADILLPMIVQEVRNRAPGLDADAVAEVRLREISEGWAANRAETPSYVELAFDGLKFLVGCAMDIPADTNVDLVAITEAAGGEGSGGDGEGGEGGGGSRGDGAGDAGQDGGFGGPLGDVPGGEALWPVAGLEGLELTCQAFLAEPEASQLVADDLGLVDRMRRLAAMLEIDECGFLGNFALNCARTIGSRSRDIGVLCARATTKTDVVVTQDGSGNNGFLDIRPGQTPEFGYLRLLAGIAADVHQFGLDVNSTYNDTRNRHLVRVDPDRDPDAAGWGLRYMVLFGDTMRGGFLHLYAETCRVLLLQQLRTSHAGISARRQNFEQTLTSFSQTLDILGETVVQLSMLRSAIRHSETVSVTGTVRRVLSVPESVYVQQTDSMVDQPPPIDSVPQRILAVIGDAVIARRDSDLVVTFGDHTWTVEELDAAIGARRALINQIDPLFLQIGSLDYLFNRAQSDPDYPRTYLTDLLAEMLRANTEMTTEASDPDEGSIFALEASQYIRREGGRDWRGLAFDLQGIHLLAEEILRPHIGHNLLYSDGVNAALSRKANFDTFLTLFGTIGIIVLGLLCAPLGAIAVAAVTALAGLALTIHDVSEADRQTDLYRALENPELFQRWQEVQLAQLMAGLSVAFSVLDFAGVGWAAATVGRAQVALRIGQRFGVGMAVRSVVRNTRRDIIRSMTSEVLQQAVRQALTAAAIVTVLNQLLPRVLVPILVPWLRRQALEHGTLDEVDAALGDLVAGRPAPVPVPETSTVIEQPVEIPAVETPAVEQPEIEAGEEE
ncbi:MAG TPA: hypothetical protein VF062_12565 [Candidatus Limnocylindrales bacterium]